MLPKKNAVYVLIVVVFALVSSCVTPRGAEGKDDGLRILVYGDSLTWGFVPQINPLEAKRYSFGERWTGALQRELGEKYTVIEEGLSGRTAGVDAAFWNLEGIEPEDQNFNGRRSLLPVVWSHEPLSAVVIMLGTNDARNFLKQSIFDVEASVTTLIRLVKNGSTPGQKPKILLISPPPARKGESELFNTIFGESAYELSLRYGAVFREIAGREGVSFFDAAAVIPVADGIDGLHLSPGANMKLGAAVARELRAMLE